MNVRLAGEAAWIVALSPFEAAACYVLISQLGPAGGVPALMLTYFYAPGLYMLGPLVHAIPFKGALVSMFHLILAMIAQNILMWAAYVMWRMRQERVRTAREQA
jgi:hypothetical protein